MQKLYEFIAVIMLEALSCGAVYLGFLLIQLKTPENAFFISIISDLSEFGLALIVMGLIFAIYIPIKYIETLFNPNDK